MSNITFRVAMTGEYARIQAAYEAWGYRGGVAPHDTLYIAEHQGELVAAVRRSSEHSLTLLRGMHVAPAFQRQGLGSKLLQVFVADLADEDCYCVPYQHLVTFYAAASFGQISETDIPSFLRDRLAAYRSRGLEVVAMRRPGRTTRLGPSVG